MEESRNNSLLSKIIKQANLIQQDFDLLTDSIRESEKLGTVNYNAFLSSFNYLQLQFDNFSHLVKEISLPQDSSELSEAKANVRSCYNRFCLLRERCIGKAEKSDEFMDGAIVPDTPEFEEILSGDELPAEEDRDLSLPEQSSANHKRGVKKRKVSPPKISSQQQLPEIPDYRRSLTVDEERAEANRRQTEKMIREKLMAGNAVHSKDIHLETDTVQSQSRMSYREILKQYSASGYTPTSPPGFASKDVPLSDHQQRHISYESDYRKIREYMIQQQLAQHPSRVSSDKSHSVPGSPVYSQESYPCKKNTEQRNHPDSPRMPSEHYSTGQKQSASNHQKAPNPGKYTLSKISNTIGQGATMTVRQTVNRMTRQIDNDDVRFVMSADYYLYTGKAAAGVVHGIISNPTAPLQASAKLELSSKQMAKYNSSAFRIQRNLNLQIGQVQRELNSLPKTGYNAGQIQHLTGTLDRLKTQRSFVNRSVKVSFRVNQFQHQRDLDNQILQGLTVTGRIPRSARSLQELSSSIISQRVGIITKKYGDQALSRSPYSIQKEIDRYIREGQSIKSQICLLERQGSLLSSENRKLLQQLKLRNQSYGKKIADLKSLDKSLKDLGYISERLERITEKTRRFKQNTSIVAGFLRSTALRPLYSPENNTAGLAYGINIAANPAVHRFIGKSVKTVSKIPPKVLSKAAPEISNQIQYQKQLYTEKTRKLIKAEKKKVANAVRETGKRVLQSSPEPAKKIYGISVKHSKSVKESAGRLHAGVYKRIQKAKEWASNTKIAGIKRAAQAQLEQISAFLQKVAAAAKALAVKIVLAFLICGILLSFLPPIITAISGACSSIILSPHTGDNGKIDLSPYVRVIEQEKRKFTAMRDDLEQKFYDDVDKAADAFNQKNNRPPKVKIIGGPYEDKDSKINISFDGAANNDRELIAMCAVRFQQDLENPEVKDYLQYMASKARTLQTIQDKTFHHKPGCVLLRVEVSPDDPGPEPPPPNPGGGSHVVPGIRSVVIPGGSDTGSPSVPTEPSEPTYEDRKVCPGHRTLDIHIHTLSLSELYEADDYEGGAEGWEGWTESNQEWVDAFLSMDWAEIYTGFRTGGMISVSSSISAEEERHIWDYLYSLTGNAYGAAGIMGNLHCESRLLSINLEDQYEGILGFTNESYTAAVDSGAYQNFVTDKAGFGIAQWTYHTRKAGLLRMAQARGVSIGDLDLQLDYLAKELQGGGLNLLSSCNSVEEASDYMLFSFENPANAQSLRDTRVGVSSYYYNKYMLGAAAEGDLTQAQIAVIEIATNSDAYGIPAGAGYCQAWAANVYGRAGFPIDNSSCARVSGERYGVSSDFTSVPPGAAVYGYSSSRYGHVGIYVGGGLVYHNIGGVAIDSLADWVQRYSGFCWGWQAGTDLTALP